MAQPQIAEPAQSSEFLLNPAVDFQIFIQVAELSIFRPDIFGTTLSIPRLMNVLKINI